jgi:hypothetical protein
MLRTLLSGLLLTLATTSAWANPPDLPDGRPLWHAPQQHAMDTIRLRGSVGTSTARLQARAKWSSEVQILGMLTYRDGWEGGLAPVDLAIGWGPMADRAVLDGISFTQNERFYYWKIPSDGPWAARDVALHSANIHVIPANPSILAQVRSLRPGDRVVLEGLLVDAEKPDGQWWRTSLVRTDTGPGACEILLLTHIETAAGP